MRLKELKRNSKFFLSSVLFSVLSVLMVAGLLIVGCSKTDGESSSSEDEIKFTVGSMPTKTAYTQENNSLQLIWVTGDRVSIYCDQAGGDSGEPGPGKTKADYDVTPIAATPEKGTLSKAASENNKGLRWGGNVRHNLYAVYPSIGTSFDNVAKVSGEEGVFTFDFPEIQYCGTAGEYVSGTNHRLQPEMYLAYMVAKQEGLMPTSDPAKLLFKPIATTLEITLQGPAEGEVEIESLRLELKNIPDNILTLKNSKYQIQFDAKKNFLTDVSNSLTAYTPGSTTTMPVFELKLSGGGNYTLKAGESVTFTVFLPPIKNLKDVDVYCFGPGEVNLGKKVILTTAVANPASKSFIKMPQFKSVNKITLSSDPLNINKGKTRILRVTEITMSDGSKLTSIPTSGFTWEIADVGYEVVTGTSTGNSIRLTGKRRGSTTVTVTYGGKTATAEVKVTSDLPELVIKPGSSTIVAGNTTQLVATLIAPDGKTEVDITTDADWRSADYSIAEVRANTGEVIGVDAGSTAIAASYSYNGISFTDTATVNVINYLTNFVVSPASSTIMTGQTIQLIATAISADGKRHDVTKEASWTSTSTATATVGAKTGVVTGVNLGSTTITASYGGRSSTARVNVAYINTITIGPNPLNIIAPGERGTLSVKEIRMSDGSYLNPIPTSGFTWEIANTGVVTFNGTSTGNSISLRGTELGGSTTVKVTYRGKTATATVNVGDVAKITIGPNPLTIAKGETGTLRVTDIIRMSDGSTLTSIPTSGFTWEIANTGVVTGTSTGNSITLTGKTAGSTTVKVTYGGKTATATVNVGDVTNISIAPGNIYWTWWMFETSFKDLNIVTGKTGTLIATDIRIDGIQINPIPDSGFEWEIANTGVVSGYSTGNSITLTGKTTGSTTVTVKYGGKTATATVFVADIIYTPSSYYQWDARDPVDGPSPFYDGSDPTTHPERGYNKSNSAAHSCWEAPSFEQIRMYLGAGVYWVEDGPSYKCPDGNIYRCGLMLKKKIRINGWLEETAPKVAGATPITGRTYESLKSNHFFLPACGAYGIRPPNWIFDFGGLFGFYWSSSTVFDVLGDFVSGIPQSVLLFVSRDKAGIYAGEYSECNRDWGYVPMPCE